MVPSWTFGLGVSWSGEEEGGGEGERGYIGAECPRYMLVSTRLDTCIFPLLIFLFRFSFWFGTLRLACTSEYIASDHVGKFQNLTLNIPNIIGYNQSRYRRFS